MEKNNYDPQERWAKKNDYITKGFKMYRSQADAFAAACEKAGVSQAAKITELMDKFVREIEKNEE